MDKEIITEKQSIVIMVAFLLGSTLVLGVGGQAKHDVWIAILSAMLMAVPVFFIYARLITIFPGKSLFELLVYIYGNILGKIIALPFIWYAIHMGSLVIRNFTEFIKIVTLVNTPQYIISALMIILCIWAVKAGIEVIGRWSSIIIPVVIVTILFVTFLFVPVIDIKNIKPILYDGLKPILKSAFIIVTFPFAETIVFTTILNNLKTNSSPYKVYYLSLLIGGLIILLVTVRSLLSLGVENILILYFPSYASVRLINIGEFLQRIEISVTIVFILVGFIKISMCLYAASTGTAKVLNIPNYRQIVAPVGLAMMILASIIYNNTMEMFEWAHKIYPYYALPFQIFLPLFILISAEIKLRLMKKKTASPT